MQSPTLPDTIGNRSNTPRFSFPIGGLRLAGPSTVATHGLLSHSPSPRGMSFEKFLPSRSRVIAWTKGRVGRKHNRRCNRFRKAILLRGFLTLLPIFEPAKSSLTQPPPILKWSVWFRRADGPWGVRLKIVARPTRRGYSRIVADRKSKSPAAHCSCFPIRASLRHPRFFRCRFASCFF